MAYASVEDVLRFWFGDIFFDDASRLSSKEYIQSKQQFWFFSEAKKDEEIRTKFAETIRAAGRGLMTAPEWESEHGKLAKIILFDQLSRNAFRGTPEAFAFDEEAMKLSRSIFPGSVLEWPEPMMQFAGMPLMHSEALADQDTLLTELKRRLARGDETIKNTLNYAEAHRDVIAKFGRFPHRNSKYNRETTEEEQKWLDSPECPSWAKSQAKSQ
mmetsp:Transcript_66974/g.139579  ORF Transcript_66974/g.139579 Transcript_66974/m.139579 type:complete len:214 (-) Transcript_66974:240-881(-)|eukprot:CAMPEP_0181305002 /NCGR_PEP_ID=MMETSP1101-20121128/9481_1 /TAXON_ID=46948 /ORGANISM="Rhodomonas abbreviata, Strain Caron Lab Isolate" /LENGTH=213 /DNA_ID=CAMNT_0023410857 /DNA_START=15 /DNA_END=656 /DNA_ORIENTATION=-